MTAPLKVNANRRNALASTGPTSDEGKAIVAANAIQHGLLSWKPVVAGFENEQEWDAHHEQMLLDLRPLGHLETVLAERVALLTWRLGRVARFESEAIATGVEDAEGAWRRGQPRGQPRLASLAEKITLSRRQLSVVRELSKAANHRLDSKVVAAVLHTAAKAVDVRLCPGDDGDADVSLPNLPDGHELDQADWTVGRVRAALGAIAKQAGLPLCDLLVKSKARVQRDLDEAKRRHAAQEADLSRFRRRLLLADEPTMERIRRYETTLERAMLRCLHELQRLQASRRGQIVPAPMALDVNLSGDGD